jgi:hypothetical protein
LDNFGITESQQRDEDGHGKPYPAQKTGANNMSPEQVTWQLG